MRLQSTNRHNSSDEGQRRRVSLLSLTCAGPQGALNELFREEMKNEAHNLVSKAAFSPPV